MNKRILSVLAAAVLLLSLMPAAALNASAKAEFDIEVPYGHPTVDGVIEEGEYQASYVMDRKSAAAWVGDVGRSKVTWYLAWDENGLYYAGTINDATQTYRDDSTHWVGIDCLELAINPGEVLGGEGVEGIFFSFGSKADGGVVAYRHNYADGLVSDQITGKAADHEKGKKSYSMEVFIPWSLVQIDTGCTIGGKTDTHIDSTGWKPEAGAVLGLLPCAIDADTDSHIVAAYKFNGTDFMVDDFVHATLLGAPATEAPTEEPTEPETEAPTEAPTETPTEADTPAGTEAEAPTEAATEAAGSGCASVCMTALPLLIAGAAVLYRKKH